MGAFDSSFREQEFTRRAKKRGYDVYPYSGRYMFGRKCPAVNVPNAIDFIAEMGMKGLKIDNMGKEYVVYTG